MEIYEIIESFTGVLLFVSIIINFTIWGIWFADKKSRTKNNYAIGPLLFSIHSVIFLLASSFNLLSYHVYFIWRNIVALHAITLLICYGILMRNKVREKNL